MSSEPASRSAALVALDVLVGEWIEQVDVPNVPPGKAVFEWALDGQFLVQRTVSPQPEFPDSIAIVSLDVDGYVQHYFDSRGVVRIYRMELRGELWTLWRTAADFSPLDFSQRFEGSFSADGATIDGRWEQSHDGGTHWELDFGLTYTRVNQPPE